MKNLVEFTLLFLRVTLDMALLLIGVLLVAVLTLPYFAVWTVLWLFERKHDD